MESKTRRSERDSELEVLVLEFSAQRDICVQVEDGLGEGGESGDFGFV